jgi:histidine decarboxylase
VFFSEAAHYSVRKSCNLLQLKLFSEIGPSLGDCPINEGVWPTYVPANNDGSIDIDSLNVLVTFFIDHGYPIIINFNYGTTFTGAMDDVGGGLELLATALERADENGLRHWIHVDGALAANYMPYVEKGMDEGLINQQPICGFDFRNANVKSICASPYKWIGSPWAFGVFVMRNAHGARAAARPNYVGNRDATISGSRNGLSSIFLWETLTRLGSSGLMDMARGNEDMANYAYNTLSAFADSDGFAGQHLMLQRRIAFSNMILFRMPNATIMNKYTLSSDDYTVDGVVHRLCHLVIVGHIKKEVIDELVADLAMPDAFTLIAAPSADAGL